MIHRYSRNSLFASVASVAIIGWTGAAQAQTAPATNERKPVSAPGSSASPAPLATAPTDPAQATPPNTAQPGPATAPAADAAAPSAAADNARAEPDQTSAAGSSSEIVVTARRRNETLMAVPVIVTALPTATLERYNTTNLTSIATLTPGVLIGESRSGGGSSVSIRGISAPATQFGFEQSVSLAIDGVQNSNGRVVNIGFFDLAQVEVLKGPQALFFGKNSTAGVISVTTANPGDHFEAFARTSYEFVGDETINLAVLSGPLTDTLGARVAVQYRHMQGWLYNTAQPNISPFYNAASGAPASSALYPGTTNPRAPETEFLGRATLKFQPTPAFTALLKFTVDSEDDSGLVAQNIGPCTGAYPRVNNIPDTSADCVADNRGTLGDLPPSIIQTIPNRVNASDTHNFGRFRAVLGSLKLDASLGQISVSSLTGFTRMHTSYQSSADYTSYALVYAYENQVQRDISEELRISSSFAGPLNFVVGGYYQNTTRDRDDSTILSVVNYNPAANRYDSYSPIAKQPGTALSFFGQAIWTVTPTVELAGGARWTHEHKTFSIFNTYGIGNYATFTTTYPGSDQLGVLKGDFSGSNVSPEVTLRWRPDADHTIFAAYRTGYKSGGFGMSSPLTKTSRISDADFDAEKAKGGEIGARGMFLNRRLNLSADAFIYNFTNLQVNTYDPVAVAFTINNAGQLKQRGLEFEGNFRVTNDFSLRGAVAYVHNRYSNFTGQCYAYAFPTGTVRATAAPPPNCSFVNTTALTLQQVYDGRAPARSPDWSSTAGFEYDEPVGRLTVGLTADTKYSGSYFAADTLAPPTLQHSFWTLNASATLSGPDNRWKVALIGRNLTNQYDLLVASDRTYGNSVPGQISEQRGTVTRGRQIALQLQTRF